MNNIKKNQISLDDIVNDWQDFKKNNDDDLLKIDLINDYIDNHLFQYSDIFAVVSLLGDTSKKLNNQSIHSYANELLFEFLEKNEFENQILKDNQENNIKKEKNKDGQSQRI